MRKFIISILLAGAAASPALAQDNGRWHQDEAQSNNQQQPHQDRGQAREQRQEVRDQNRAERSNGGANAERMQQAQQAQQQVQQAQQQARQQQAARQFEGRQQGRGDWNRSGEGQRALQQQMIQQQQQQQQAQRNTRGYRGGFNGQVQEVDQTQRNGSWARNRSNWSQQRDGDFRQGQGQVQQQQYARQNNRWANGGWNRNWRNDRRYDWRSYRNQHRTIFHLGVYFDPFGYGYRSFDIGYNMAPLYFGQQYWIDPALYGLPYPPPGTVWVRYWNDAVLVDSYTGEVVDMIHNFFW